MAQAAVVLAAPDRLTTVSQVVVGNNPNSIICCRYGERYFRLLRPAHPGDEHLELVIYGCQVYAVVGESWSWE